MSEPTPPTRRARKDADLPAGFVPPRPVMPEYPGAPIATPAAPPAGTTPPTTAPPAATAPPTTTPAAPRPADDLDDPRLATAQREVAAFGPHPVAGEWLPAAPPKRRSLAPAALGTAIVALAAAVFVGWLLPLGLIAIVLAAVALRRRGDSRAMAGWALALGILSVLYSAGWLLWAVALA